tara:strand:+ start:4427 stop:5029 length:603 start_codon:yes stop_codon:yes gene_type:complete
MKLTTNDKVLIGGGILAVSILAFFYLQTKLGKGGAKGFFNLKPKKVLLLGGLDTRSTDKNISEQEELLKLGLGKGLETISYRYNNPQGILDSIKAESNVYVILFSAGCSHAEQVAKELKEQGGNLANLYIVEPYHVGGKATKSVRNAVGLGVPSKNVLVGNYKQAGLGIVDNATSTPNCSPSHWCALEMVGKKLNLDEKK